MARDTEVARSFLITIDAEGDDLWSMPRAVTTRNARFLPRFQDLCERISFGRPTSPIITWRAARTSAFGRDLLRRQVGEIGMHLHAWDTPPLMPLTADDSAHLPYLTEYPAAAMRAKVRTMTGLLEDTFGVKMVSHRARALGFQWRLRAAYPR